MIRTLVGFALLAACGAPVPLVEPEPVLLGMNDVSFLLPLPLDPTTPVLASMTEGPLARESLVLALVDANRIAPKNKLPVAYADFQVVAVRFDLCARDRAGACPDEDGRLRLILQPLYSDGEGKTVSHDIALHAFYPVPADELPVVIAELRELAALQATPLEAPLGVNTGVAIPEYATRLRDLVLAYARDERLLKITVMGQNMDSAAFAWIMGGFERVDDSFVAMLLPGTLAKTEQRLLAAGGNVVYEASPLLNFPIGFQKTLSEAAFATGTDQDRVFALESLAAIENPMLHEANDVQCIGCHVATILTLRRSETAGVDPFALHDRYRSSYNLAVDSITSQDPRSVRAFGWGGSMPAISQRVANDTARVLTEIEERFPVTVSP